MRVWRWILRLIAAAVLLSAVFAISFIIAVTMRPQPQVGTLAPIAAPTVETTAPVTRPALEPELSEQSQSVPTTAPPIAFVEGAVELVDTISAPPPPVTTEAPPAVELNLDPVFASIESRLSTEVDIAIRLPAQLDGAEAWSATIDSIDANRYVVHVEDEPDCNAASACRTLTFTGSRSTAAEPSLPAGTTIPLPNGERGVFVDSSCGADCNNGFIVWVEDDVRYSVGSRVASGPAVLDLAWRSIDTALPTPSGPQICGPGAPKHNGQVARTITTEVDDQRSMHWIAVCSGLGFDIEIVEAPGDLRWTDVDGDDIYDAVITHADGSSTIFAIDGNRPLGVIDTSGGRLQVGDLKCVNSTRRQPIDAATNERLEYINSTSVRRVADPTLSESDVGDC